MASDNFKGYKLAPKTMDSIITLRERFPVKETARILGVGTASVNVVESAYNAARSGDIRKLMDLQGVSSHVREWAAARFGYDLDAEVERIREEDKRHEAYSNKKSKRNDTAPMPDIFENSSVYNALMYLANQAQTTNM